MISVVIPLYNKEKSIIRTIHRLKSQTMKQFEVIIVDDGSTDSSFLNAKQAIGNDVRFKLLQKSNGGVSSARNEGIRNAKYEYISFLDADDYWEDTYLEELVQMIELYPTAGIYGIGWNFMYNDIHSQVQAREFHYHVVDDYWNAPCSYFTSSSTTTTTTVLNAVGLFNENVSIGEDVDMWCRILLKYKGVYYDKPLAYYVQDSENRLYLKHVPIDKNWVNYLDRYKSERMKDITFRKYIDKLMAAELVKYLDSQEYHHNNDLRQRVKYLRSELDFNVLPVKTRIRLIAPWLFRLKKRLCAILNCNKL